MVRRKVNHRPLVKYSIGDLRDLILIHTRSVTPPLFNSADFTETYDVGVEHWAGVFPVTTQSGQHLFDGVNIEDVPTDIFIIRFDPDVTAENVISFDGDYYKILDLGNPERRSEYQELRAKLLGDKILIANA